jgi:transglutaminase superfamily protein
VSAPMRPLAKAKLAARIWALFFSVRGPVKRRPIPDYVASLGAVPPRTSPPVSPHRLRRAVERTLRIGPWRPRCLVGALVLYRLLREQGDAAELVIGLPVEALTHEAHAWVELDGVDMGPAPGRAGHEALARFA